jgi:hypothetical protein
MRKYEHDTSYFGGDILRAVRCVIERNPDLDRGGVYVWSIASNTNLSPLIIYLNMNENDFRGSLECHRCGNFKSQISYDGILSINDDSTDCEFDQNKVIDYLKRNIQ